MSPAALNQSKPKARSVSAPFLENTGAAGYVVHLSCRPALEAALAAKSRGVKIFVESVLPHFLLDNSYAERVRVSKA